MTNSRRTRLYEIELDGITYEFRLTRTIQPEYIQSITIYAGCVASVLTTEGNTFYTADTLRALRSMRT